MIQKIKYYIEKREYQQALKIIEKALLKKYDLEKPEEEDEYSKLLMYRVTVQTFLGKNDSIISDLIRREKYPSESEYIKGSGHKINMLFQNSFLTSSDAYVNTVSAKNPFTGVTDWSASSEFIKRMGRESLNDQLEKAKELKKGEFFILKHDDLSAPMSYHILFYDNVEDYLSDLAIGVRNVLKDACNKDLNSLSFFPLGFALVKGAEEAKRSEIAEKLADKLAEVIVIFISDNDKKKIPRIIFNFVTYKTMQTFDRAFYKWVNKSKIELDWARQFSATKKSFINDVMTKNINYVQSLNKLSAYLDSDMPILLLGETGVGKTKLAKLICKYSTRRGKTFKEVNCAMLKPDKIYTQLFGCEKNSFTDSKEKIIGAIEYANEGILFLDEIGYADIEVQQMLLKFIDSGEYTRFGGEKDIQTSNVRLIFGTNVDIMQKISDGEFAHDFYERISQFEFTIPPLRERKEDIRIYIEYFMENLNQQKNATVKLSDDLIQEIEDQKWFGNIRQLKNYIEKIHIYAVNENIFRIDKNILQIYPIPISAYFLKNKYKKLENIIHEILKNWEIENGNVLNELISPILANAFSEIYPEVSAKDTKNYIGMGDENRNSVFKRNRSKYKETHKKYLE